MFCCFSAPDKANPALAYHLQRPKPSVKPVGLQLKGGGSLSVPVAAPDTQSSSTAEASRVLLLPTSSSATAAAATAPAAAPLPSTLGLRVCSWNCGNAYPPGWPQQQPETEAPAAAAPLSDWLLGQPNSDGDGCSSSSRDPQWTAGQSTATAADLVVVSLQESTIDLSVGGGKLYTTLASMYDDHGSKDLWMSAIHQTLGPGPCITCRAHRNGR